MRALLAAALMVAILGTGCVFVSPRPAGRGSAVSARKCPPGHQWSDGSCHSRGKGHDPAKHMR